MTPAAAAAAASAFHPPSSAALLLLLLLRASSAAFLSLAYPHPPPPSRAAFRTPPHPRSLAAPPVRAAVSMSASASSASPPSWDALREVASSLPVGSALDSEFELRESGVGSPHVQSKLRLFGSSSERPPKLTLYRDHAGWCPYCQKTMLLVEEKGVPMKIELVPMRSYGDKPESFLRKVPGGLLPALGVEKDGGKEQIITESQVIMELLDRWHPVSEGYRPMLPPDDDTEGNARYDRLSRLERELFSWWCTLVFRPEGPRLGGGGGGGGIMGMFGGKNENKEMSGSMKGFLECLDRVDSELTSTPGPWFYSSEGDGDFPSGDYPTMIDFVYVSHLERMLASCAYWKGLNLRSDEWKRRYPGINAWFDAFEKRESYLAFKSDYYTHVMDIPPQYGPGNDGGFEEERREYSRIIRGRDGESWNLPLPHDDPLQPLYRGPPLPLAVLDSAGITPDSDGTYENSDPNPIARASRHLSGWKLASNGPDVSRFASRGGPGGARNPRKGFGAELADPYAEPDGGALPYVDAALRVVCSAMLERESGTEAEHLEAALGGSRAGGELRGAVPRGRGGDVSASLAYLRDRVGVPRDMPLAAARQLRAHLNWAIGVLSE